MPRLSGALLRCLLAAALCVAATLAAADGAQASAPSLTAPFTTFSASLVSGPPVSIGAPVISGETVRGSTLIVNSGSWNPSATAVTYQWQRDSGSGYANITGATTTSYTLTPADVGASLQVHVVATNASGSGTVDTAEVGPVIAATPVNSVAPAVTGSLVGGQTLTASRGTWYPAGTSYAFQWQRDTGSGFANISGATSSTYTTILADVGARLRANVTATNPYASTTVATAATGTITTGKPVSTVAPGIYGTVKRGVALTVTAGTWSPTATSYGFQWQRDEGSGFADIVNATNTSYTPGDDDIGYPLRVTVTATNGFGSTDVDSAATGNVATDPPVNVGTPGIAGTPKRSFTLTASAGSWTPAGAAYTYQWQRDTGSGYTNVSGATSASYTLVAADVAKTVRVAVKATNVDGNTTAYSAPTATIEAATPGSANAPVVTGQARVGAVLTTTDGTWSPAATSYAYQWQRKVAGVFTDISGATAKTYTLVSADANAQVRAKVTATNADGDGDGYSAATPAVVSPPVPPTTIAAPTGTLADASTLTIDGGTWTPASTTLTYQWLRCAAGAISIGGCTTISTGRTYALIGQDVGSSIVVRVTGTFNGVSTVATSGFTATIQGRALTNVTRPTITGTVQVAQTVRAEPGTWSVPTTTERYQWRRCDPDGTTNCADIPGASRQDYKVVVSDKDHTLVLREFVTSPGRSANQDSVAKTVADQPVPTVVTAPVITGTAERRSNLQVSRGAWTNTPTSFAYQWRRCDTSGANCADIPGAVRTNYVLTHDDTGHTVVASVTATNTEGSTATVTAPTGTVATVLPVLMNIGAIRGTLQVPQTLQVQQGIWRTSPDTNYSYQWQRCDANGANCVNIVASRQQAYRLVTADARARLRVIQTATNPDGAISAATTVTIPIVPAKPGLSVSPRMTVPGRPDVGKTITLTPGAWSATTEITAKVLNFYRCNPRCSALTTNGAGSYLLTEDDAGGLIRGSETATGPGGTTVAYASSWIGPVRSATAASSSFAARGGTQALRTSSGVALASATVGAPTVARAALASATRDRTVTVSLKRAARAPRGALRAWACLAAPPASETAPCTKAVSLGGRRTTLRLKVAKGAAVRVTVVRSRRR